MGESESESESERDRETETERERDLHLGQQLAHLLSAQRWSNTRRGVDVVHAALHVVVAHVRIPAPVKLYVTNRHTAKDRARERERERQRDSEKQHMSAGVGTSSPSPPACVSPGR